ncbi:MAG TPA: flagellin [Candidatus Binataceae bacterium]|nr:flagellin [Candidatus Binataceae bacterium]
MISVQTNVDSMLAQSNLSVDNQFQSKTIQQLTSGFRINRSGDDAAGLAIANGYRNDIAEMTQGIANANDGIAQLQIVDGGLANISTILDRMKTLATQSASDTFTGDRSTLNQEYSALLGEIDRQAANIGLGSSGGQFNGSALSVYVGGAMLGGTANASVSVDLTSAKVDSSGLALNGGDISTSTGAATALDAIGSAVKTLGLAQGAVGAGENQLQYAVNLLSSQIANYSTAQSSIRDADVAADAANLTKSQVLEQTAIAAMAQANSEPQAVLKLLQ